MVEVNVVCKNGRYDKISLNSLCVMSNVKVFATQDIHIDPYDTDVDKKSGGMKTFSRTVCE